jgi:hypothetical protein
MQGGGPRQSPTRSVGESVRKYVRTDDAAAEARSSSARRC